MSKVKQGEGQVKVRGHKAGPKGMGNGVQRNLHKTLLLSLYCIIADGLRAQEPQREATVEERPKTAPLYKVPYQPHFILLHILPFQVAPTFTPWPPTDATFHL